jgi:glucose-6-phosphate 1-dehydrogenase
LPPRRLPKGAGRAALDCYLTAVVIGELALPETVNWSAAVDQPRQPAVPAIAIHFRPLPQYMLDRVPGVEPKVPRLGLTESYVRLATTLNGPDRRAGNRELEVHSTRSRRTPYANLILEMLNWDPMLVTRGDEAEEAWRIIDPVMKAWSSGDVPMRDYAAGGPPPSPAL